MQERLHRELDSQPLVMEDQRRREEEERQRAEAMQAMNMQMLNQSKARGDAPVVLRQVGEEEIRQEPVQNPALATKSQQKKELEVQKRLAASPAAGVMQRDQIALIDDLRRGSWASSNWMKSVMKGGSAPQDELYERVENGDYSDLEHLDPILKNQLASLFMINNFVPPLAGQDAHAYVRRLAEEGGTLSLQHPLFRLGVSLAMRSGFGGINPGFFRELDAACGSELLAQTISKQVEKDGDEEEALRAYYRAEGTPDVEERLLADKERNVGAQVFMAKTLLLAQLSDFQKVTKGRPGVWDTDVGTAFTHCSRVSYIMPAVPQRATRQEKEQAQAAHDTMWQTLREVRASDTDYLSGNAAGIFKRGSSTHSFHRRRVGGSDFKEKKVLFNLFGQEGLNVPVGGLGSRGINGRVLVGDGSCGHIYTSMEKGEEGICGGFLVGYESDSYKKTNQLGHTHGLGNGEAASSFGGQRCDEIGDKYGGRVADLSGYTPEELSAHMLVIERYVRVAAAMGESTLDVMRRLSGSKMERAAVEELLDYMEDQAGMLESQLFIQRATRLQQGHDAD